MSHPKRGNTKDSVGWKRTLLTSLIVAIVPVVFGGSALISFIISVFYTPNVSINWISANNNDGNTTLSFLNRGGSAASNVLLTIQSPSNDTHYNIFSTENYSLSHQPVGKNPWFLQLRIARFVQGQGSIVSVDFSFDNARNASQNPLVAYSTYDQGSAMMKEKVQAKPSPVAGPWETIANSISQSTLVLTILAIISSVIALFFWKLPEIYITLAFIYPLVKTLSNKVIKGRFKENGNSLP